MLKLCEPPQPAHMNPGDSGDCPPFVRSTSIEPLSSSFSQSSSAHHHLFPQGTPACGQGGTDSEPLRMASPDMAFSSSSTEPAPSSSRRVLGAFRIPTFELSEGPQGLQEGLPTCSHGRDALSPVSLAANVLCLSPMSPAAQASGDGSLAPTPRSPTEPAWGAAAGGTRAGASAEGDKLQAAIMQRAMKRRERQQVREARRHQIVMQQQLKQLQGEATQTQACPLSQSVDAPEHPGRTRARESGRGGRSCAPGSLPHPAFLPSTSESAARELLTLPRCRTPPPRTHTSLDASACPASSSPSSSSSWGPRPRQRRQLKEELVSNSCDDNAEEGHRYRRSQSLRASAAPTWLDPDEPVLTMEAVYSQIMAASPCSLPDLSRRRGARTAPGRTSRTPGGCSSPFSLSSTDLSPYAARFPLSPAAPLTPAQRDPFYPFYPASGTPSAGGTPSGTPRGGPSSVLGSSAAHKSTVDDAEWFREGCGEEWEIGEGESGCVTGFRLGRAEGGGANLGQAALLLQQLGERQRQREATKRGAEDKAHEREKCEGEEDASGSGTELPPLCHLPSLSATLRIPERQEGGSAGERGMSEAPTAKPDTSCAAQRQQQQQLEPSALFRAALLGQGGSPDLVTARNLLEPSVQVQTGKEAAEGAESVSPCVEEGQHASMAAEKAALEAGNGRAPDEVMDEEASSADSSISFQLYPDAQPREVDANEAEAIPAHSKEVTGRTRLGQLLLRPHAALRRLSSGVHREDKEHLEQGEQGDRGGQVWEGASCAPALMRATSLPVEGGEGVNGSAGPIGAVVGKGVSAGHGGRPPRDLWSAFKGESEAGRARLRRIGSLKLTLGEEVKLETGPAEVAGAEERSAAGGRSREEKEDGKEGDEAQVESGSEGDKEEDHRSSSSGSSSSSGTGSAVGGGLRILRGKMLLWLRGLAHWKERKGGMQGGFRPSGLNRAAAAAAGGGVGWQQGTGRQRMSRLGLPHLMGHLGWNSSEGANPSGAGDLEQEEAEQGYSMHRSFTVGSGTHRWGRASFSLTRKDSLGSKSCRQLFGPAPSIKAKKFSLLSTTFASSPVLSSPGSSCDHSVSGFSSSSLSSSRSSSSACFFSSSTLSSSSPSSASLFSPSSSSASPSVCNSNFGLYSPHLASRGSSSPFSTCSTAMPPAACGERKGKDASEELEEIFAQASGETRMSLDSHILALSGMPHHLRPTPPTTLPHPWDCTIQGSSTVPVQPSPIPEIALLLPGGAPEDAALVHEVKEAGDFTLETLTAPFAEAAATFPDIAAETENEVAPDCVFPPTATIGTGSSSKGVRGVRLTQGPSSVPPAPMPLARGAFPVTPPQGPFPMAPQQGSCLVAGSGVGVPRRLSKRVEEIKRRHQTSCSFSEWIDEPAGDK